MKKEDNEAELLAKYDIQSKCIELAFHVGTYIHGFQKYSPEFRSSIIRLLGGISKAMGKFFEEHEK
jgi:hypothetical protein